MVKRATYETHFVFNNEVYDRKDGVSRGSPLAPFLDNLSMDHEKDWIEMAQVVKAIFYV